MSDLKLSMSVERLPMTAQVPLERRGLLTANLFVTDKATGLGNRIELLADESDTFTHSDLSAMFRLFADIIERKHGDKKVAA